ncbi:hypothetical protein [Streptomyces sp. NPDC048623]|uniref:hypothetical protein n=1 Tax=Streptomyces sp. NPDC048623 TaxID=3155761 RepID=UPI0034145015
MTWQWIGLTFFSLTVLPAGLAVATGRVPERLHHRPVDATAPVNALPRMAGAFPDITLARTAAGGALAVAGCLVLGSATIGHQRRPVAAPHEGS